MLIKQMNNIFTKENAFNITLVASIGFLVIFSLLSYFQLIQSIDTLGLIGEASRWCERVSGGIFREPINTLTNLGFMVVGLYILYKLTNEISFNEFSGLNKITILYGVTVVYLGPGSMMMHGTNTEWGGWADNLSMVMYITIPWLYNCYKMSNWSVNTLMKIYFSIILVYAIMRGLFGDGMGIGLNLFGVSIGLWVISEFLYKFWSPYMRFISGFVGFLVLMLFGIFPMEVFENINDYWWIVFFWLPGLLANKGPEGYRTYGWYFAGMIAYMSAFAIWLTGVPDSETCNPDGLFQAHGIWHLLTALSTILFFYHYRSEKLL
tara:strand:+ start:2942 stop:3904 length:963 start_codon:yes stop_codon:yes gene_type:complete